VEIFLFQKVEVLVCTSILAVAIGQLQVTAGW